MGSKQGHVIAWLITIAVYTAEQLSDKTKHFTIPRLAVPRYFFENRSFFKLCYQSLSRLL
jgi:hypothetical protein